MAEVIYHEGSQRCSRLSECSGILWFEPHIAAAASSREFSMRSLHARTMRTSPIWSRMTK